MLALLLLACRPSLSLAEVPIEGGTAEQRDTVRAVLVEFDAAVGVARIALRSVELVTTDEFLGSYDHFYRRVELNDSQETFSAVVRHELCHALVSQDRLLDPVPDVIGDVQVGLFDPDYERNPVSSGGYHEDDLPSEAVANFCEMGPVGAMAAEALVGPGVNDPDPLLRRRLAGWLLAEVWTAAVQPSPLALDPVLAVRSEAESSDIRPTEDPEVVTDLLTGLAFDLYTGAAATADLPPLGSDSVIASGLGGSFYAPGGSARAGVAGGASAYIGSWDLYHLGTMTAFVAADDAGWRVVGDGSVARDERVFTADGDVWTSFTAEDGVQWTSLSDALDAAR